MISKQSHPKGPTLPNNFERAKCNMVKAYSASVLIKLSQTCGAIQSDPIPTASRHATEVMMVYPGRGPHK